MSLHIIIAGGSSSRLWPLSRELYPKQFLTLTSELTLLQQTLSHSGIILEPVGRNTAPAITLAALYASNKGEDSLLFGVGCGFTAFKMIPLLFVRFKLHNLWLQKVN